MNETPPPKPPQKLESVNRLLGRVHRDEAAGFRGLASRLLAAELAADWPQVAAVRASLVEIAHELEALAAKRDPP